MRWSGNVEARDVKPRDLIPTRDNAKVASVDNTPEFHTILRFDDREPLRWPKVGVVTVIREMEQ